MDARVRPARKADKGPLMSFVKDNWGGHDYIPRVWDEWLKSRAGRVFVAEVNGVPLGMCRVKFQEDRTAWLEAARVHPEYRGLGLATMLGESLIRAARGRGSKVFRLCSRATNHAAHRQIARMNFREKSRVSIYEPKEGARFKAQRGVRRAGVQDLIKVAELIMKSREFRLGSGVYWDTYEAFSLTPPVIENLVRSGAIWTAGRSVAIAVMGGLRGEAWRQVCFLTGEEDEPVKLVRHVFGLKGTKRESRRMVWVPQGSRIIGNLRRQGFDRQSSQVLFELAPPLV
jgi:GNAT superfamily N-acetyltransferase